MIESLGDGIDRSDSYFSDDVVAENISNLHLDGVVSSWDDSNQWQLYQEAMTYLGHRVSNKDYLCFKSEQMSAQLSAKTYGYTFKESTLKEIKNLTDKIECFYEIACESLMPKMKYWTFPFIIFMVMKRSGEIKNRVCENDSL